MNGDESVAAFRIRFGSDGDAGEFLDAQADLLEAAAAKPDGSGVPVYVTGDGHATARAARSGSEVVFVIASNKELAAKAIAAVVNG